MGGHSGGSVTRYPGIQVQTSSLGVQIPIGWGTFRCKCNLVWYNNFQSKAVKAQSGKGGQTTTGYSYSADLVLAICEGPIDGVTTAYVNSSSYVHGSSSGAVDTGTTPAMTQVGLSLATGAVGQPVWSHLTSSYPTQAIGYSGLALAYAANYPLDSGASTPNHSFEVVKTSIFGVPGTPDADPSLVIKDFFYNPRTGVPLWNQGAADTPAGTNYFLQSQSMLSSPWTGSTGAGISTTLVDPDGGNNVLVLTFATTGYQNWTQPTNLPSAGAYTQSVWLWARGTNIGQTISLDNYDVPGGSNARLQITLTGTPTRYSVPFTLTNIYSSFRIIRYDGSDTALEVLAWGPQLEAGSLTAYMPSGAAVGTRPATNGLLGSLAQYQSYCLAAGLLVSPVIDQQRSAKAFLDEMLMATNSTAVWSEGVLKFIPYGDTALTGNGATYTPNVTPVYLLNDDSFVVSKDEAPLKVDILDQSDAYNVVQFEYLDRTNQYNMAIALSSDAANVAQYGERRKNPDTVHVICTASVAAMASQLFLQRTLYTRGQYKFKLGWMFAILEPGDIVDLTDTGLGLTNYPVRIIQIDEDEQYGLSVIAEDAQIGVASSPLYTMQQTSGYQANQNIDPGNASSPVLFNAPLALTGGALEVWIGSSGGPNWWGAQVWTSLDGTNYEYSGTIDGPARYGTTTTALPIGSDPDVVNTVGVNLSTSAGILQSAAQASADAGVTLCLIDQELIAYETATLTGANQYTLGTYLRRGMFGTTIAAHNTGAPFVRIDGALFEYGYLSTQANALTYVKFVSFNEFGSGLQNIATVPVYEIIPAGVAAPGVTAWAASGSTVAGDTGTAPTLTVTGAVDHSGIQSVIVEYRLIINAAPTYGPWQRVEYPATATNIAINVGTLGSYQVHVRYRAVGGAENAAVYLDLGSISCGVSLQSSLPNITGLTTVYQAGITRLTWVGVTDYRKPDYEIRIGSSWAAGTSLGRTTNTTFTTNGDASYWVAAHYAIPNGGGDVYSATPTQVIIAGSQLTNNVVATYSESGTSWTGSVANSTVTAGTVQLNTGSSSGGYQIPAGHRINTGRVAACNVVVSIAGHALSLTDDVLSVTNFLGIADLLDGALGPLVSITPQIRLSQDGTTWGAWANWSPGSYIAMAFDFQVLLATTNLAVVPVLTGFTIAIDAPNRTDSYPAQALLAGGSVITFATPFNGGPGGSAVPNVQATIVGATAGDDLIMTWTASAITAQVKNGGVGVARTVSFIAQGY